MTDLQLLALNVLYRGQKWASISFNLSNTFYERVSGITAYGIFLYDQTLSNKSSS